MNLRHLVVLPFLLTALVAQTEKPRPQRPPTRDVTTADSGEEIDGKLEGMDDKRAPKPNPNARRRGTAFCQFRVHSEPVKMMPGQSGKLLVTALLRGTAVLPASAPLVLALAQDQGMVTLGTPTVLPARPGHLHAAFQGAPVYDNYAVMEVPVTISQEAAIGSTLPVRLQLDYELLNGDTAAPIGKFSDVAPAKIEVGVALDPAVKGGFTPIDPRAVEAPVAPARPAGGITDPTAGAAQPDAISGTGAQIADSSAPAPGPLPVSGAPAADVPSVEAEDELSLGLLLGGGGALLVIVLLLVMRRK
jgi:hypothetical protein